MAADLQSLINAIPSAEDGHVITPDYHNTLRAAVMALASQSGGGTTNLNVTMTYAPVFLPVTDGGVQAPQWVLALGMATRPVDNSAKGWFPIQLPDGARIRTLTVTGNRSGNVLACSIRLMRFTVLDATTVPLITVSLKDLNGEFVRSGEFSATIPPDFQIVDTGHYQYLISAELVRADPAAVVELYSFQVACGKA